MKKKKRGAGTMKSTTTVLASVAFASFITCCTSTPHFTLGPMSRRLFSVNATSSAENGVPSRPGDAGARLDGELLEVRRVLVAFRQPHIGLVGERAVVGERLVDDVRAVLVVGADRVWVPQLEIHPAALAPAPHQAHRPVARRRGRLRGRQADRRQRRGGRGGRALDDGRADLGRAWLLFDMARFLQFSASCYGRAGLSGTSPRGAPRSSGAQNPNMWSSENPPASSISP